jgi:hypothetical protein
MDVLLTGLPRSGLSVVGALLDSLPDTACLSSPPWQMLARRKLPEPVDFAKWLAGDFLMRRVELLHGEPIRDWRALDGSPLLDGARDPRQPRDENGRRIPVMLIRPGLSKDFTLAIKHPMLYTALLPTLAQLEHFKIIVVIRHPYDVIASWRSLNGRPVSERLIDEVNWPQAAAIAHAKSDVLDRMVQLYDLHLGVYHELRDRITILKYEDVAANPFCVGKVFGRSELPAIAAGINPPPYIRAGNIEDLRARFKKYGVFTREYYRDI